MAAVSNVGFSGRHDIISKAYAVRHDYSNLLLSSDGQYEGSVSKYPSDSQYLSDSEYHRRKKSKAKNKRRKKSVKKLKPSGSASDGSKRYFSLDEDIPRLIDYKFVEENKMAANERAPMYKALYAGIPWVKPGQTDGLTDALACQLSVVFFGLSKEIVVKQDVSLCFIDGHVKLSQAAAIMKCLTSKLPVEESERLYPTENLIERAEVDRWLAFTTERQFKCSDATSLHTINSHLVGRSFFVCQHITLADIAMFASLHGWMTEASLQQQTASAEISRWLDHIQHLPGIFGAKINPFAYIDLKSLVNPISAKSSDMKPKKRETKETVKDVPKEKLKKNVQTPVDERPIEDPTRLDIRVGRIIKAWNHPEAERLYCEEIDIGEDKPRQIASGLRDHIEIQNFEGQLVLVLANLKEKKLRGFPSHGMVLCGKSQTPTGEKVELVIPPAQAVVGERVSFTGLCGKADEVLSSKTGKDPFVAVQPGFRIDDSGIAYWKNHLFSTVAGNCTCSTIRGGGIS